MVLPADSVIEPAEPPVSAPRVDTLPPAETSSTLPAASDTVAPASEIAPPLVADWAAPKMSRNALGAAADAPASALLIQAPRVSMPAPCATTIALLATGESAVPAAATLFRFTAPAGTLMWPSTSIWFAFTVSVPPAGPASVTPSGTVTRPLALRLIVAKPVDTLLSPLAVLVPVNRLVDSDTCALFASPRTDVAPNPAGSDDSVPGITTMSPMPKSCVLLRGSSKPIVSVPARGAAASCWLPVVTPPRLAPSSTSPLSPVPRANASVPPAAPCV